LANPADERANYEYNVDKGLTMLRFQRASDGLNMGVLSWHAVNAPLDISFQMKAS
jgi:neutral ceramidase